MEILEYYNNAKNHILTHGYKDEVEWCEKREPFELCTPETLYFEYVYVVLNAGMKEQIARKIYERFCKDLDFNMIGHLGKREATRTGSGNYKMWFNSLQMLKTDMERIEYLKTFPWIGDITKFHLARNIGIDCVKPDRHLVRLAEQFGFKTPFDMCVEIQRYTNEKLGVIDVVLWRYCNLNGSSNKPAQDLSRYV